eukprot:scaffold662_cov248-Pinguiococcus_pyrenoidosus.AAC.2
MQAEVIAAKEVEQVRLRVVRGRPVLVGVSVGIPMRQVRAKVEKLHRRQQGWPSPEEHEVGNGRSRQQVKQREVGCHARELRQGHVLLHEVQVPGDHATVLAVVEVRVLPRVARMPMVGPVGVRQHLVVEERVELDAHPADEVVDAAVMWAHQPMHRIVSRDEQSRVQEDHGRNQLQHLVALHVGQRPPKQTVEHQVQPAAQHHDSHAQTAQVAVVPGLGQVFLPTQMRWREDGRPRGRVPGGVANGSTHDGQRNNG